MPILLLEITQIQLEKCLSCQAATWRPENNAAHKKHAHKTLEANHRLAEPAVRWGQRATCGLIVLLPLSTMWQMAQNQLEAANLANVLRGLAPQQVSIRLTHKLVIISIQNLSEKSKSFPEIEVFLN